MSSENEVKIGQLISIKCLSSKGEYWELKPIRHISCYGDLRDDSFIAGEETFYFKNKNWMIGIHPSLIPDGFTLTESNLVKFLENEQKRLGTHTQAIDGDNKRLREELEAAKAEIERLLQENAFVKRATCLLGVKEGWQLVPIDPTRSMLDASIRVEEQGHAAMYAANLKAAPKPFEGS